MEPEITAMPDALSGTDASASPVDKAAQPDVPITPPRDRDLVRDFILATHSDIVPELIQGETTAELMASVQEARAAYATVRDAVSSNTASPVPAGGGTPLPVNPERLPPSEKIRRGLSAH